jgi:DNA invertase Pin-like site-specific DNA recombinase
MSSNLAFSYIRMSSGPQIKGDSLRRQLEKSEAFAAEHNRLLDTRLRDLGKSAYTGANRKAALGRFLEMVRLGQVPRGSWLLVEALDRISRDHVDRALRLFLDIIDAGIVVVTLSDRQFYSTETIRGNYTKLIISIAAMSQAHEDSALKGGRVSAAWSNKRANPKKKLTAKCPGWLRVTANGEDFDVLDEQAALMVRAFEETAAGMGRNVIVKRFNREGIKTFGRGKNTRSNRWHSGTLAPILTGRQVLGEYQPHRLEHTDILVDGVEIERVTRRVPVGDPWIGYYPAILSEDLWERAQAAMRANDPQKGATKGRRVAGRKGTKLTNLFGGLISCGACRRSFIIKYGSYPVENRRVMRCSGFLSASCENRAVAPYHNLENAVIDWLAEADFDVNTDQASFELERQLAAARATRSGLKGKIANLVKKLELGDEIESQFLARKAELKQVEADIVQLKRDIQLSVRGPTPATRQRAVADLRAGMTGPDPFLVRSRAAQVLRDVLDQMSVEADGRITLVILGGLIAYRLAADLSNYEKVDLRGQGIDPLVFTTTGTKQPDHSRELLYTKFMRTVTG